MVSEAPDIKVSVYPPPVIHRVVDLIGDIKVDTINNIISNKISKIEVRKSLYDVQSPPSPGVGISATVSYPSMPQRSWRRTYTLVLKRRAVK
jgi:hypothetical protein